jgi:hypothetical protein
MTAIAATIFGMTLYLLSRVLQRAGFSPWWALIGLVPLANLVMLWWFAFNRWPAFPTEPKLEKII